MIKELHKKPGEMKLSFLRVLNSFYSVVIMRKDQVSFLRFPPCP